VKNKADDAHEAIGRA